MFCANPAYWTGAVFGGVPMAFRLSWVDFTKVRPLRAHAVDWLYAGCIDLTSAPSIIYCTRCVIVFSCVNFSKSLKKLSFTPVYAQNRIDSTYSEKVHAKCVFMLFWCFLPDFSRDVWLLTFELFSWECLTLDGYIWFNTFTVYNKLNNMGYWNYKNIIFFWNNFYIFS